LGNKQLTKINFEVTVMKKLIFSPSIFLGFLPQCVFIYATLIFAFSTKIIFAQIVPDTAQVRHVTGGIVFAEGPLWHPDGFLLCSDINGNKVLKIDPQTGAKEVYLSPSGGANGLAFDRHHNLIMCRGFARDLARLESDGSVTILASHYDGKRFNSPNDLTVRSDGTIFFTDPTTGDSPELDFDGVYALKPNGELALLDTTISMIPNGITLSPDEQKLYVNETLTKTIYVYDIENDTTLTNKSVFAVIPGAQYADGMKVDVNGNLFVAALNAGVWIYSPNGQYLDSITVPGNVTNINWGDADYKTLDIIRN
jgi:sugar lactone lactonase YvrE